MKQEETASRGEAMNGFTPVWHHRLKYMLTPQMDLYQNIDEYINQHKNIHGLQVLDVGCGSGFGTLQLVDPKRQVWGTDIDHYAIEFAKSVMGSLVEFSRTDYSYEAGAQETFDVITCIEVIEHVRLYDDLIGHIKFSAKDDTLYFFSTLNHNSQYRKNAGHIGKWRVNDFRDLMYRHFSSVVLTDYTLKNELDAQSSITPMVAICQK